MRRVLPLVVLASIACVAQAWIDTGHMVIAQIAERDLTAGARKQAEELLAVGGDERTSSFVTCASWADDAKTAENGHWHYVNVHFRTDGKRTQNRPENENVVWAIERFSKVLADRSLPKAQRADALRFLIHFVGDVHQPLHTVTRDSEAFPRGDRGGNGFPIVPPPSLRSAPKNLHFLWDEGGGLFSSVRRPLDASGAARIQALADKITTEFPKASLSEVSATAPQAWCDEGLDLAKSACYARINPGSVPSDRYLADAREASARRIALAGYRLSALLNRLLG